MTFSIGSVLSRSFQIYLKNFLPFVALATIIHLPLFIYQWTTRMSTEVSSWKPMLIFGLQGLLGIVLTSTIVFGVVQQLRGRSAGLAECLSRGFRSLGSVLVVAIVMGLIVFLGFMLLIIPGLILACMYWVAVPCAIVEKAGVGDALRRSAELTRGERWAIFGIILLPGLMIFALAFIGGMVFSGSPGSLLLLTSLITVVFSPWQSACQAVGYHDLRVKKEGLDTQQLAAVFG